jgi:hypothetical protein
MVWVTNLQYVEYCILKCDNVYIHINLPVWVFKFTSSIFWVHNSSETLGNYTRLHGVMAHLESLVPALKTSDMLRRCYTCSQQVTTSASWQTSHSSADQECHLKLSS